MKRNDIWQLRLYWNNETRLSVAKEGLVLDFFSKFIASGRRGNFDNYINPGYGLSLVDALWNASSYRQPLEQEGTPMT